MDDDKKKKEEYIEILAYLAGAKKTKKDSYFDKINLLTFVFIFFIVLLLFVVPRPPSIVDNNDYSYVTDLASNLAQQLKVPEANKSSGPKRLGILSAFDEVKIVKKLKFSPGRDYMEGFFYIGDNIIASQKIVADKVVEQNGSIPDGKVEVINEEDETYGEEYYRDNKINGVSRIYYSDGKLKREAVYSFGKLTKVKDYFKSGTPQMEVDYSDAKDIAGQKETGIGKLYFRDGKLKYEWDITESNERGYKKSYNNDGEVTSSIYYDYPKENTATNQEIK